MEILYHDKDITVCVKPAELLSESTPDKRGLADLLAAENGGYIGVIHRLDRGVGGVMVYANTPTAAATLSRAVAERAIEKEYIAVLHGSIEGKGELRDLLFHDKRMNKTFCTNRKRAGVKEAVLEYTVLKNIDTSPFGPLSLVRVRLLTGRTHQIRVQFASRGMPLLGDGKYGASGDRCPIALFSSYLSFDHPSTHERLSFSKSPDGGVWELLPPSLFN